MAEVVGTADAEHRGRMMACALIRLCITYYVVERSQLRVTIYAGTRGISHFVATHFARERKLL